jgi:triacylglycerol lipase
MSDYPVVFVHGLFGWGPDEVQVRGHQVPYWGTMRETAERLHVPIKEVSVGPVSSFHDRACEVAFQIWGGQTDYGEKHARQFGHKQKGKVYEQAPFNWDEDHPIHLVGHSAGAHTCLYLQQLLEEQKVWPKKKTNAKRIKSISSIAGVLNGSTLTYMLGCDKRTGKVRQGSVADALFMGVELFGLATGGKFTKFYDFDLQQWHAPRKPIQSFKDLKKLFEGSGFGEGTDNLAYDLTLQGCQRANDFVRTYPETYYMSYVTEQTKKSPETTTHIAEEGMNPVLELGANYQGRFTSEIPLIFGWGQGMLAEEKWHANDGAVSEISQRYPFTHKNKNLRDGQQKHPVGEYGIHHRNNFAPGQWYWEKIQDQNGKSWDHLDVGFGVYLEDELIEHQRTFYQRLFERLRFLP